MANFELMSDEDKIASVSGCPESHHRGNLILGVKAMAREIERLRMAPKPFERGLRFVVLGSGSRDNGDDCARSEIYRQLDTIEENFKCLAQGRPMKIHVVQGGAKGADRIIYDWTILNGHIPLTIHAWWELYKKRTGKWIAGRVRNKEMRDFVFDAIYSGFYDAHEQIVFHREGAANKGTSEMEAALNRAGMKPIRIEVKNERK